MDTAYRIVALEKYRARGVGERREEFADRGNHGTKEHAHLKATVRGKHAYGYDAICARLRFHL